MSSRGKNVWYLVKRPPCRQPRLVSGQQGAPAPIPSRGRNTRQGAPRSPCKRVSAASSVHARVDITVPTATTSCSHSIFLECSDDLWKSNDCYATNSITAQNVGPQPSLVVRASLWGIELTERERGAEQRPAAEGITLEGSPRWLFPYDYRLDSRVSINVFYLDHHVQAGNVSAMI